MLEIIKLQYLARLFPFFTEYAKKDTISFIDAGLFLDMLENSL